MSPFPPLPLASLFVCWVVVFFMSSPRGNVEWQQQWGFTMMAPTADCEDDEVKKINDTDHYHIPVINQAAKMISSDQSVN
jgi:hypothetical protein